MQVDRTRPDRWKKLAPDAPSLQLNLRPLKRAILPSGTAPRKVRHGIARGVRMRLDLTTQLRLCLGLYELELDRHWKRLLRPGASAFDVGAQFGYDSLAIASRTHSRVAAFECEPGCLAEMDRSFALNPKLAPLIQPVHATVGLGDQKLGLDEWAFSGGFVPDLIKVDVEGAELEALRSAHRILATRRPAVIVEVHSPELERDTGQLLVSHGYRPLVVSQRRLLPDHRPTAHNRWLVAA